MMSEMEGINELEPLIDVFVNHDFNVQDDDDQTPYQFRVDGVTILYENLKKEYIKVHRKIPKHQRTPESNGRASWMRVKDGELSIIIEANRTENLGVFIAKVVVQRERAAYDEARQMSDGPSKYVGGQVSLTYSCSPEGSSRWRLKLDLDSVYSATEDDILKEVYALCPSNIEVTNKFQLVTELYLQQEDASGKVIDRLIGKKISQPFLLRTEPRGRPGNPLSPTPSPDASSGGSPRTVIEAPDGNFNNLQAKSALVGTLEAQVIRTQNRDIGYHIPLKDLSQKGELNEGDVVGFFEDDYEKTVIERLSKENYHRAKLAGVITRSFYVEGLCPESQKGTSDLVCIIGIVKVRVMGTVRNGEQLYAYKKKPGVAAAYSRLCLDKKEEDDKPFLIGQALESRSDVQYNEETLVPAFVSVVTGIDCLAMNQRVKVLDEHFKGMIRNLVYDATKKIKRRFFWLKALLLVAMLAVGIALWQRFGPNTLLRASLCKRGSYNEHTMILSYNTSWQEIKVTALEFKFKNLKDKIYNSNKLKERKGNPGDFRYFINFERCKNRGVSYGNEYVDQTPTVAGPEILSSDAHCTPESVKYLNDGRWVSLMTNRRGIKISRCFATLH